MNSQPSRSALFGDARIVLAGAGIDRERRPDAEPLVQLEEPPRAHPHAVFVPAPVRHVGQQRHAGRRRQHLARHRPADVPDFVVDDGPDHEPRAARQFERRPVDDRRELAAVARQHRVSSSQSPAAGFRSLPPDDRGDPDDDPPTWRPALRCDIIAEREAAGVAYASPNHHRTRRWHTAVRLGRSGWIRTRGTTRRHAAARMRLTRGRARRGHPAHCAIACAHGGPARRPPAPARNRFRFPPPSRSSWRRSR